MATCKDTTKKMNLVDSHVHVFPPELIRDRKKLAERDNQFAVIYGTERSKMADGPSLLSYMGRERVGTAFVCGFNFQDRDARRVANEYVLHFCEGNEGCIPFISIDVEEGDAAVEEIEAALKRGARGVGEIAFYGKSLSDRLFDKLSVVAGYMEEKGLILLLHMNEQVGHGYRGKAVINFNDTVKFIERHPGLMIILAHLGGGLCFYELMPEIGRAFRNVRYDLAAVPFLYSDDVYRFIGDFLSEKVLFGTDYPLTVPARYASGLKMLTGEQRRKILTENALTLVNGREQTGA